MEISPNFYFQIAASSALRGVLEHLPKLREYTKIVIQWPSTNTDVEGILGQLTEDDYHTSDHVNYPQWTDEVFDVSF